MPATCCWSAIPSLTESGARKKVPAVINLLARPGYLPQPDRPDPACQLLAAPALTLERPALAAAELAIATPATINLSVPTGPVTINITVKVERTEDQTS